MSNMVVQTNVLALNAHRNMKSVGTIQSKASQKLSSGFRINSAADDAAGLAISEKMRAQIRGLDMASKNSQDAISLIQTAEGGMQEIDNMVQRIRELVVYASNDTNDQKMDATKGQGDRRKIQDEIDQLMEEIDSMAGRVEFNQKTLINGTYSANGTIKDANKLLVSTANTNYVDAKRTAEDTLNSILANLTNLRSVVESGQVNASVGMFTTTTAQNNTLTQIDNAIIAVKKNQENIANKGSDFTATSISAITLPTNAYVNSAPTSAPAQSAFADALSGVTKLYNGAGTTNGTLTAQLTKVATMAGEVRTARTNAITAATVGQALHFQVGANARQNLVINIGSVDTFSLGIGAGRGSIGKVIDVVAKSGSSVTSQLNVLDKALSVVTTERAKLGAFQNRLEYTIKSLDISSENLSASESRIRDTDMAKEMMNLTKANVLQQASVSMLAQANQAPQSVLQLLR